MITPGKIEAWTFEELPDGGFMLTIAVALYDGTSWIASRKELSELPPVNDLPLVAANGTTATRTEAYNAFKVHGALWSQLNTSLGTYASPLT